MPPSQLKSWPTSTDYAAALQSPHIALSKRKDLGASVIATIPNTKQPKGISGQFAIVYEATLPGGQKRALRVFTSERKELASRYRAISDYLKQRSLKSLVHFEYLDKGIRVADKNGQLGSYPVVLMEWVQGASLFEWVQVQCRQPNGSVLRSSADRWAETVDELFNAQISHGDLQHGNVLVQQSGEFKFVDYDCMCVPALVGRPNLEIGVNPYQHPKRDADTKLSMHLDNFSALFILVALRALAASPTLWREYVEKPNYDKLLFKDTDFANPGKSHLLQALSSSKDPDVSRLSKELVGFYGGPIHDVPPLRDVLFSYSRVESLLNAHDWDAAVELLERKGTTSDAPAALGPRIEEARKRVNCRKTLEACVQAADEQCMATTYDPKLLDDYPRAQAAVQAARPARQVIKLQADLLTAQRAKQWREFVRLWDANRGMLEGRKSSGALKRDVDGWRERNRLCDEVRRLAKLPTVGGQDLDLAWTALQSLGGHPELSGQETAALELQLRRGAALKRHRAVVAAHGVFGEAADRQTTASWAQHGQLLAGLSQAAADETKVAEAAARLKLVAELERLAQDSSSNEADMRLEAFARRMPKEYGYAARPLVEKAVQRLAALVELTHALEMPQSDTGMCAATQKLIQAGGQDRVNRNVALRIKLASLRLPLLQKLKALPKGLPLDKLDRHLRQLWDAALLDPCDEAAPWRGAHGDAVERGQLLQQIERAIKANKPAELMVLADNKLWNGYPIPAELQREFSRARESVRAAKLLIDALVSGNSESLRELFSVRMVRENDALFRPHRERLGAWIRRDLFHHPSEGLSPPKFGQAMVVDQGSGPAQVTVRWKWPRAAHEGQCVLAVCPQVPAPHASPAQAQTLEQMGYDRKHYEDAGGKAVIHMTEGMRRRHLVVWAMIDLGFEKYYSDPIVLGQFPS